MDKMGEVKSMKSVKRRLLPLLLIPAIPLVLGLYGGGYPELYQRILIHGIGVDFTGEDYLVTVRSSLSPEDEGEEVFTCRGETVLDALSQLSLSTGREPFYAHNYLVVFGMDCARQGLDECLDFFVRYYNTRPAVKLFLALGTAEEVLRTEQDGKLMRMSQLQALASGGRYNGMTAEVDLLDFVNRSMAPGGSGLMPVLKAGEEGVSAFGTAYFDGAAVAGTLSLEQTRGWLAATGRMEKGELTLEVEGHRATLSLRGVRADIEPRLQEGLGFDISLKVQADISSLDTAPGSGPNSGPVAEQSGGTQLHMDLQSAAERLLKEEIQSAAAAAGEDGCDILGFGNLLYRKQPQLWKEYQDHRESWARALAGCQVGVHAQVKLRRLEQERAPGGRGVNG